MISRIKKLFCKQKKINFSQACKSARFTTDQMEDMGAKYMKIHPEHPQWGWHFPDDSIGFYDEYHQWVVFKQ